MNNEDNQFEDLEDEYNESDEDEEMDFESPLAKEFSALCEDVQEKINLKLNEASKALEEAQEIADKHGVPFGSQISPISNHYVPKNFGKTKFSKLDLEVVKEISGVWGEYIDDLFGNSYGSWVHSAVC